MIQAIASSVFMGKRRAAYLGLLGLLACVPRERPDEGARGEAAGSTARASGAASKSKASGTAAGGAARAAAPASGQAASGQAASGGAAALLPDAPGEAPDPLLDGVFSDDFERASGLGPAWRATSAAWQLDRGRLCGENAKNHPVWLARRLPLNARIEFQALSESEDGDIKAEFWGDGRSSASGQSYTDATSYLTIFGGWKNRYHVLARLDEHAANRREIKLERGAADPIRSTVEAHRVYQFHVERRDGRTLRWSVDGAEISSYPDEEPLSGPGHEHFGFNDWQVRVCFDNLRVTPLED